MSGGKRVENRLTDAQRRLVADNLGLVSVHLRRNVRNLSVARHDREWEDLFQEGCLGLIQAAVGYREERGIPFAAFALPRIHKAISRALQSKFSTVYVPPRRSTPRDGRHAGGRQQDETKRPKVYPLPADSEDLVSRRRHSPENTNVESVGERIRGKYERAVHAACNVISRTTSTRGDRDKLARILAEERLLVPHPESRRPLRQIARETRSSYARVAQCSKLLENEIRQTLQSDPEFLELRHCARADLHGSDLPIDDKLEGRLARASADEFARRFREGGGRQRVSMLDALLDLCGCEIEDVARTGVMRLSIHDREKLFWNQKMSGRVAE